MTWNARLCRQCHDRFVPLRADQQICGPCASQSDELHGQLSYLRAHPEDPRHRVSVATGVCEQAISQLAQAGLLPVVPAAPSRSRRCSCRAGRAVRSARPRWREGSRARSTRTARCRRRGRSTRARARACGSRPGHAGRGAPHERPGHPLPGGDRRAARGRRLRPQGRGRGARRAHRSGASRTWTSGGRRSSTRTSCTRSRCCTTRSRGSVRPTSRARFAASPTSPCSAPSRSPTASSSRACPCRR